MLNRLCLGTAQFGLNYGIANRTGKLDYPEIKRIVASACEHKLQYFDTAQAYGDSEIQLGRAFTELNYSPRVISKLAPDYVFSGLDSLTTSVGDSLERLQLPYLHGLLLHRLEPLIHNSEFLEAIRLLKRQGMIRNFGVSVYTPEEAQTYVQHPAVDMVQVPCNIFDRRLLDKGFFSLAEERGKQVFIRSVYLQGLLHLDSEELAAKGQTRAIPFMDLFQRFLRYYGLSGKTFAAHALLEQFPQAILVIGIDSLNQFMDNLAIFKAPPVPTKAISAWWGSLPQVPVEVLDCRLWK